MVTMIPQDKTFIISEAGINHGGSLQKAKDMAYASMEAGCNAVKFQTYQVDKRVDRSNGAYDILKRCEMSYDNQYELIKYCNNIGIEFFSTPFDTESLDFLLSNGVNRIKIASFDVVNSKFLNDISNRCLSNPLIDIIMSVGMSNEVEITSAINALSEASSLTLLHCISSYPTPDSDVNLSAIKRLALTCNSKIRKVGYSDHTSGIDIPPLAVLVGATVIEKHFTLDRNDGSVDNPVSADPKMMSDMVSRIRRYEEILGNGSAGLKDIEKAALAFRRST